MSRVGMYRMSEMAKLILKMARKRAREHDRIMRAIAAAHRVYKERKKS